MKNIRKMQIRKKQRFISIRTHKTMTLSKCAIYGTEKSIFTKKQEAKGIFSSLGLNTFTEMNQIKLVFSIIWLMEILKIQQGEQLLTKF